MLGRMPGRCDRSSRRLLARAPALWLAVALALVAAPVPAAIAAGFNEGQALNKLTEGQETETSTTSTTATTTKSPESSTTSSTILIVVVGAAVVLLSGVAFVIIRDARRVAPATDVDFAQGSSSARHTEAALRRRRAKAKAARRQRKRNR
jgi:beta-lactamase regulating signal transducer with metallopeptidase domain